MRKESARGIMGRGKKAKPLSYNVFKMVPSGREEGLVLVSL